MKGCIYGCWEEYIVIATIYQSYIDSTNCHGFHVEYGWMDGWIDEWACFVGDPVMRFYGDGFQLFFFVQLSTATVCRTFAIRDGTQCHMK